MIFHAVNLCLCTKILRKICYLSQFPEMRMYTSNVQFIFSHFLVVGRHTVFISELKDCRTEHISLTLDLFDL